MISGEFSEVSGVFHGVLRASGDFRMMIIIIITAKVAFVLNFRISFRIVLEDFMCIKGRLREPER